MQQTGAQQLLPPSAASEGGRASVMSAHALVGPASADAMMTRKMRPQVTKTIGKTNRPYHVLKKDQYFFLARIMLYLVLEKKSFN